MYIYVAVATARTCTTATLRKSINVRLASARPYCSSGGRHRCLRGHRLADAFHVGGCAGDFFVVTQRWPPP